jgi:hypothetical protein
MEIIKYKHNVTSTNYVERLAPEFYFKVTAILEHPVEAEVYKSEGGGIIYGQETFVLAGQGHTITSHY